MRRLAFTCLVMAILLSNVLAQSATAAAIWRGEVLDYQEPAGYVSSSALSSWRGWLWGKLAIQRPPVGTTFTVNSSAYASSPYQTDSTPCITAAGTRVRQGVVASNFLPMGTLLEINGEAYIVEDRMNPRYAGRFVDIWFPSTAAALQFGRQKLQATIVGYGTLGQELTSASDEALTEGNPVKPTVIERASLRFIAVTRYIARAIPANVNKYDVNCFE